MNKKVIYALMGLALIFFIASLIIFLRSGDDSPKTDQKPTPKKENLVVEEPSSIKVKAFFFVEGLRYMRPLPHDVELTGIKENYYQQFLDILLKGAENFIVPVPDGVTLRSLYLIENQNMLVVDFSENLIHTFPAGTTSELEFIYFFVNNICFNFKEIKRVKFMIAGNEYQTISGHIDIENPFLPDFRYIKDQ